MKAPISPGTVDLLQRFLDVMGELGPDDTVSEEHEQWWEHRPAELARDRGIITVYVAQGCEQSLATCAAFDGFGVRYERIDLATSPAAAQYVAEDLGLVATPVVVVSDVDNWSGHRPEDIVRVSRARR